MTGGTFATCPSSKQAEEFLWRIADGTYVGRFRPLVDIPADDAFPPCHNRNDSTREEPGGRKMIADFLVGEAA
jgi:hypothetical protein